MARPNNRLSEPSGIRPDTMALMIVLGGGFSLTVLLWTAVAAGHHLQGTPQHVPDMDLAALGGILTGEVPWPGIPGAVVLCVEIVLLVVVAIVVLRLTRGGSNASRVDRAAAFLGAGKDIAGISAKEVAAKAARMGIAGDHIGVPIGVTVRGKQKLYGSWEDTHIDIWGPRTGKTTSRAIPAIMTAPGAVLATSNKRDIVDATRGARAEAGPVWVFDPQQIANEPQNWWWNPLSYVTDEVRAAKLAEHFAADSRETGSRSDAFFQPAGQRLLANYLLAAALGGHPITDVYTWLTSPEDITAAQLLQRHGYALQQAALVDAMNAPDKQRAGIYATAQGMAACLTSRKVVEWVTPGHAARELNPEEFVTSGGTLYSLSREGQGSAGALVTALTVAIVETAEKIATTCPGGRLRTPLLCVLDEAANVCKWSDLPNLYSHYGSRGIVVMTILQSWSQGVEVWGEAGMKKLWSSANVKVYGGGVSETAFLKDLSDSAGDYDRVTRSASHGRDSTSVSTQLRRDSILTIADLAAMPRGRALVMASGQRTTLVKTQPWMNAPYADLIRASLAAHDAPVRPTSPALSGSRPTPTDHHDEPTAVLNKETT